MKCIKLANQTLGSILFTELGLAFFNLIINAYFICTVYALFVDPFPWVVMYFIIVNLLSFIMAMSRIFNPKRVCDKLNRVMELSKDCLQNYEVFLCAFSSSFIFSFQLNIWILFYSFHRCLILQGWETMPNITLIVWKINWVLNLQSDQLQDSDLTLQRFSVR